MFLVGKISINVDYICKKKVLKMGNNKQKAVLFAETFQPNQSDTTTILEDAQNETSGKIKPVTLEIAKESKTKSIECLIVCS